MTFVCDSTSPMAPEQCNDNVVELVKLTASLTSITEPWPQKMGADGEMYYIVDGHLEVVYESASTKYTFIYKGRANSDQKLTITDLPTGKRCKTVTAEYI
jgi:hypothetical protein